MTHHITPRLTAARSSKPYRRAALLLGLIIATGVPVLAHSSPKVAIRTSDASDVKEKKTWHERIEGVRRLLNEQLNARNEARAPSAFQPVKLFVSEGCPYCEQARRYLDGHGIPYQEIDTATPSGASAYAQASAKLGGARGVPLLVQNERLVNGFGKEAYDRFFEQ